MIPRERGFLLLTSHLGDPERRVLTYPQLRDLAARVAASVRERAGLRSLAVEWFIRVCFV